MQSKFSIYAWYLYDFANTVYATVAMTFFIPLIVGSLADDSTAMYVNAFSVFMQALFCISSGGLADYGSYKKSILVTTTWVGGLSCILIGLTRNLHFIAVFVILSNVAYGVSLVVYNAYLPFIVREHIVDLQTAENAQNQELASPISMLDEDIISSQFSSYGFAWGYIGGVLCLIIAVVANFYVTDEVFGMQLALIIAGVWWLSFGTASFVYLKSYPGESLPPQMQRKIGIPDQNANIILKGWRLVYITCIYIQFSWQRLFKTVSEYKKLPNTFLFLISFALYADAAQTMTTIAILFAQSVLKVPKRDLFINAMLIPFVAAIGNVFWLRLQKAMGWSSKTTLTIVLFIVILVPFYAAMGKYSEHFFLHDVWEIYPVCIIFGFTLGAWQALSRAILTELIPKGKEAEFFSLYEITDKGSAWIGPLLTAVIRDWTGDFRNSFWALILMLLVAIPILQKVNMEQGRRDVGTVEDGGDLSSTSSIDSTTKIL